MGILLNKRTLGWIQGFRWAVYLLLVYTFSFVVLAP
jgi:hypothetical protein